MATAEDSRVGGRGTEDRGQKQRGEGERERQEAMVGKEKER